MYSWTNDKIASGYLEGKNPTKKKKVLLLFLSKETIRNLTKKKRHFFCTVLFNIIEYIYCSKYIL